MMICDGGLGNGRSCRRLFAAILMAGATFTVTAIVPSAQADPKPVQEAEKALSAKGPWVVDGQGRVRIHHGVNIIREIAPFYPKEFSAVDARLLANEGFTLARIGFLPIGLEPELGKANPQYLEDVREFSRLLGSFGIDSLLLFQQDAYAARCRGDGFPDWATLGDPEQPFPKQDSEGAPPENARCKQVWRDFWADKSAADGVGLQKHYAEWWALAVKVFAGEHHLLGYDLFNEPLAPDYKTLGATYRIAIDEIRKVDPRHIIYIEDMIGGYALGAQLSEIDATPTFPAFHETRLGYTDHAYCSVSDSGAGSPECLNTIVTKQKRGLAYASETIKGPYLLGEFGAVDNPVALGSFVDNAGSRFIPWAYWQYYGDVANLCCKSQGVLIDDGLPGTPANAKQAKLDQLVVPYPSAIAGTPQSYSFDRATKIMKFSYGTHPAGYELTAGARTVIFVPKRHYRTGYTVQVAGGTVMSRREAPWLEIAAAPGAESVSVILSPAKDGKTLTPLEAGACGPDLQACR